VWRVQQPELQSGSRYNHGENFQEHISCNAVGAEGKVCVYVKYGVQWQDYYGPGINGLDYKYGNSPAWAGTLDFGAGGGFDDDWFYPQKKASPSPSFCCWKAVANLLYLQCMPRGVHYI